MPKNSKKTENNIISFEEHKNKREQSKNKNTLVTFGENGVVQRELTPEDYNNCVTFPLPDEIEALYFAAKQYEEDENEPAPLALWTGETWEMFLDEIVFPYADEANLNPFDVLAVFLSKMNGMKFNRNEDGFLTSLSLHS